MKRIAAPMVGGMIGVVIDELIVLPAIYSLWKEWQLRRQLQKRDVPSTTLVEQEVVA